MVKALPAHSPTAASPGRSPLPQLGWVLAWCCHRQASSWLMDQWTRFRSLRGNGETQRPAGASHSRAADETTRGKGQPA